MKTTPETDNLARGNHVVPTEWAEHLNRERDEACQVANGLAKQVERLRKERDEAREEIRDWKRLHDAAERGVDLTIAEGTISDLLKQRDDWAAMCGRYKQERDIAEQDATNYHARIIELIDERDKTKRERDEAREKAERYRLEANAMMLQRDEARELVYAWESRWKAEVEFAAKVSVKRDELQDILRKLLGIIPEPECHDFGHTKEERHTFFEKCPVMERYDALIAQAKEAAK